MRGLILPKTLNAFFFYFGINSERNGNDEIVLALLTVRDRFL